MTGVCFQLLATSCSSRSEILIMKDEDDINQKDKMGWVGGKKPLRRLSSFLATLGDRVPWSESVQFGRKRKVTSKKKTKVMLTKGHAVAEALRS